METSFGFSGKILYVDLSTGEIRKEPIPDEWIKKFGGGLGINVKLAYDHIPIDTEPLSPENAVILGSGPMVGTLSPGAPFTSIVTLSPMTGYLGDGRAGNFGYMLKCAGYDHLVVTGRADSPVYLKVDNEDIEICDASQLWGKRVHETAEALLEKHKDHSVCCIGPAGENLVRYGANLTDAIESLGCTNGAGAVMGSKNLKAISVRGTVGVKVKHPEKYMELVDKALNTIKSSPFIDAWRKSGTMFDLGYYAGFGCFTAKNWREGYSEKDGEKWGEIFFDYKKAGRACIACPIGCKSSIELKDRHQGLALNKSAALGPIVAIGWACDVDNFEDVMMLANEMDALGLDMFEAAHVIGFAMELYEQGVIDKKDTDGMELNWGFKTALSLVRKIAYREGFGDILAEGVKRASKIIGKGAEKYAVTVKGISPGEDGRAHMGTTTFGELTNPAGGLAFRAISITQVPGRSPASLRKYGKKIGMPEEKVDQIFTGEIDGYNLPRFTKWVENFISVFECVGLCQRSIVAATYPFEVIAAVYDAATGIKRTSEELVEMGDRIWNLEKAFDALRGQSRKDDRYPPRWLSEPVKLDQFDPEERSIERLQALPKLETLDPLDENELNSMLDEYYEEREWNIEKGIPTPEKLRRLGLEDVADDLRQHNIF